MSTTPTFLVGAERSGTTLFRLLVDSHPEVTAIEGLDYVIGAVGPDGERPAVDDYAEWLATETVFSTAGFTVDRSLPFDEVADDFLRQRMAAAGKDRVAVLLHTGLETALSLWPEARFIHLVRDPRAVALSTAPFEWSGHPFFGVHRWIDLMGEWRTLTEKVPADRLLEIHFEDLVTDHGTTLGTVCDFLGVTYTDEMLSYAAETDYDEPIPAKADEWRAKIDDDELRMVEGRVGEWLETKGYEASGLDPIDPSPRDLQKMKLAVRLKKWKHKLTSHGWVAVAELATRKAGVSALHTPMKQRMNGHERQNRKKSWREPGREFAYGPAKAAEVAAGKAS
ncbi:MAG: sulfotransferase family protein [Acidimicrobiales bacterium]